MRRGFPLLAAAVVALVAAPAAHAGVTDFVNEINAQGVNIGTIALNPSILPSVGQEACDRLHKGWSMDEVLQSYPSLFGDGPRVIAIAQATICPDTLR